MAVKDMDAVLHVGDAFVSKDAWSGTAGVMQNVQVRGQLHSGKGSTDRGMRHLGAAVVSVGEGKNNPWNGVSLSFVNSHGESKFIWENIFGVCFAKAGRRMNRVGMNLGSASHDREGDDDIVFGKTVALENVELCSSSA